MKNKRAKESQEPNYKMLFEALPDGYLVIDNNFITVAVSDSYLKEFSKNRKDVLGRNIFEVLSENTSKDAQREIIELKDSIEKVYKNHIPDSMPLKRIINIDNNGRSEFCCKRTNYPIMDKNGNIISILHKTEDVTAEVKLITENKDLSVSKTFLKNIINNVADPIFVKDKHHHWIDGNKAFINLMGRPEQEIFGKTDYDFFPKEQADIFWEKDEEVFDTKKENINIEYMTDAKGVNHVLSTKKACFEDTKGDPILVGIIRDITEVVHMQEQLKESGKAYLLGIIDNSLDAIITFDQNRVVTEWNKQAEIMFGWIKQEAIGAKVAELTLSEESRNEYYKNIGIFLDEGKWPLLNTRVQRVGQDKHGKQFPIEVSITAQKQFGSYYFTIFIRDISEQKKTEESKALLAAIVEYSDDAIVSNTLENKITSWNKGAERLFGFTAAEMIGKDFYALIPKEMWVEEKALIEKVHNGIPVRNFETKRMHKDGHLIDVSVTTSPIYDGTGKIIGYSKLARDITARKKTEMQLMNYTAALERSNKELDDFAYIASHDLKEPLRGINNYSQFLLEDNKDKLDEESAMRLKRLIYLSKRMETLVNDLLYFSRIGRQELAIQQTDINTVIKDVETTLDIFLKDNNAKIILPKSLPVITCDKTRVTEVFQNLITNAVKYNDNETKIVEIGYLNQLPGMNSSSESHGVFYVKDNGRGIPEKFYNEIFRIFKRLQTSQNEEGTGVGLTFVKKIIERHGGRIWLESEVNKGTTFYFTLGE